LQNNRVFVSGSFTEIFGQPRKGLALIKSNTNNTALINWDPKPNGLVNAMTVGLSSTICASGQDPSPTLFVGGEFTCFDGGAATPCDSGGGFARDYVAATHQLTSMIARSERRRTDIARTATSAREYIEDTADRTIDAAREGAGRVRRAARNVSQRVKQAGSELNEHGGGAIDADDQLREASQGLHDQERASFADPTSSAEPREQPS
jgi:hypothetical protein